LFLIPPLLFPTGEIPGIFSTGIVDNRLEPLFIITIKVDAAVFFSILPGEMLWKKRPNFYSLQL
jgi:hypothetical protein